MYKTSRGFLQSGGRLRSVGRTSGIKVRCALISSSQMFFFLRLFLTKPHISIVSSHSLHHAGTCISPEDIVETPNPSSKISTTSSIPSFGNLTSFYLSNPIYSTKPQSRQTKYRYLISHPPAFTQPPPVSASSSIHRRAFVVWSRLRQWTEDRWDIKR